MGAFEFKVVEYGVQELSKGGVTLKHPEKVGVVAEGLPATIRDRLPTMAPVTKTIFTYQSKYRGFADAWGVGRIRAIDPDGDGSKPATDDISDRWLPETANIKLRCICQYDGPEVTATFDLAPTTCVPGTAARPRSRSSRSSAC